MRIGFYDDASFRWSNDRLTNLDEAAAAGASVIHTTASWAAIAPTRPANAASATDPAYHLSDLDELVANASQSGLQVMIQINGTPKWANGGQTPNHMPKRLADLTTFAKLLATRYNGHTGHGNVARWSVWNEPNLQLFLTPQFVGKKIVGPANYAKLYKAAYAGIKAGNKVAQVAIGETSNLGRDKPTGIAGQSQSVSPGTFARLVAQTKGLKFAAWATHPYPTAPDAKPLGKVRYPNVSLAMLPTFRGQSQEAVPSAGADLDHRVRLSDEAGPAARRHDRKTGGQREGGAQLRPSRQGCPDVHLVHLPGLHGQSVEERSLGDERNA